MHTGKAQVVKLIYSDGCRYIRIACPANFVPAPGQYLLASDNSASPLPASLFYTDWSPDGFIAASPEDSSWTPGQELLLRGPLGRGFSLPMGARKVGLVTLGESVARLKGLIRPALRQEAAVVLVSDFSSEDLPDAVEVQPLSLLGDILEWADYAAFDLRRENIQQLQERLGNRTQLLPHMGTQVLVRTPVPCGGMADCGVCAVALKSDWKLACKDGPVFDWGDLDSKVFAQHPLGPDSG
jgi:NAD(P)H-flavin reductase